MKTKTCILLNEICRAKSVCVLARTDIFEFTEVCRASENDLLNLDLTDANGVAKKLACSRSTVYAMTSDRNKAYQKLFPKSTHTSEGRKAWAIRELDAWILLRFQESRSLKEITRAIPADKGGAL